MNSGVVPIFGNVNKIRCESTFTRSAKASMYIFADGLCPTASHKPNYLLHFKYQRTVAHQVPLYKAIEAELGMLVTVSMMLTSTHIPERTKQSDTAW